MIGNTFENPALIPYSRRWWKLRQADALVRRHPDLFLNSDSPFQAFLARCWCRIHVRRRNAAADVLQQFLAHKIDNLSLRIRQFLSKIRRVQRHAKAFVRCQDARLQLLWLVMERAERRKQDSIRRARFRREKEAKDLLRACRSDYVATAISIDEVAHKTSKLLAEQRLKVRRIRHSQALAQQLANMPSSPLGHSGLLSSLLTHKKSWKERVLAMDGAGAHRLGILRNVLRHQRQLHVNRFESLEARMNRQKPQPRIDLADVRDFLRDKTGKLQIRIRLDEEKRKG